MKTYRTGPGLGRPGLNTTAKPTSPLARTRKSVSVTQCE
uniref:Uncharacterized protein n=1 Tax=Anguilla anguilla TaxID=7936 RepID=A0A0E9Q8S8_ANGAN